MAASSQLNLQSGPEHSMIHLPRWNGPKHVKLCVTTKLGGYSQGPFTSWNLAEHVHDDPQNVSLNRQLLSRQLDRQPFFLNQVHSNKVVAINTPLNNVFESPIADGAISNLSSHYLAILTADCLPILFCDGKGEVIAACHAGWRGLADGIINQTLQAMLDLIKPNAKKQYMEGIHVYIGPAITQENFEVGVEVKECFSQSKLIPAQSIQRFFTPNIAPNKYLADLFGLAIEILNQSGVHQIFTEKQCSYNNFEYFYSYRRDKVTGRFASCIWFE